MGLELASASTTAATSGAAGAAVMGDATRIIQAVAMGVGFLGAGAIFQARGHVEGLTTAAGIWVVSAIGLACGTGMWAIAMLLTLLALVTLSIVRALEPRSDKSSGPGGNE